MLIKNLVLVSWLILAGCCFAQVIGLDARNGFDSAYNLANGDDFSGFRAHLTEKGFTLSSVASFNPSDLSPVDMLVVLQPFTSAQAFSPSEVAAIQGFTGSGRGLLVLGDAGGGSSASFINPLANLFGVTFSNTGTEQQGHLISSFNTHPLTRALSVVGLDYQRQIIVSATANDLTPGTGGDDFLAVSGNAVFLSDSSLFANVSAGGDYPLTFGDNAVLLENTVNFLAVPEPTAYPFVTALSLLLYPFFGRSKRPPAN